jgi:hypothetical protein
LYDVTLNRISTEFSATLFTPASFVDPNPTPVFVHLPPSTYFLYPHLLVSGNWLIHLFFVINLNFPAKYPSLESPHAAGQPSGPLWHVFETMRILCSVDKTFWPRKKRKRKRLKTVLASGDAFEQSKHIQKMGKIQSWRSFIDQPVPTRIQQCEIQNVYTTRKPWLKTKTNQYCPRPFHGEKGHVLKSDNFNGITSTTTGIHHFQHQQQWLKLENQSWKKKNLRL